MALKMTNREVDGVAVVALDGASCWEKRATRFAKK